MEQVIVVEGGRGYTKEVSCTTPPRTSVPRTTYQVQQVKEECPQDCCIPVEIIVPLKKTCVCLSQTPVMLFIILLTLVYIISAVACWCACSCDNGGQCKSKDGDQCDTDNTARWTAFAINTLVYILLAIVISMWIYRTSQFKQSRSLGLVMSVAVPIFCWWFFWYINELMFSQYPQNGKSCN